MQWMHEMNELIHERNSSLDECTKRINEIYEQYDEVVEACAHQYALLLEQDDIHMQSTPQ